MKKFIYAVHVMNTFLEMKCHCQTVFNEIGLHPIPDELQEYLKNKAIKHGQGESSKTMGSIYNIPTEAVNICKILQRPAD